MVWLEEEWGGSRGEGFERRRCEGLRVREGQVERRCGEIWAAGWKWRKVREVGSGMERKELCEESGGEWGEWL